MSIHQSQCYEIIYLKVLLVPLDQDTCIEGLRTYLMRIEVGVEDDDSICAPEVNADAARTSCQEIYEDI